MVLHLGEGEAVLGVTVSLGHNCIHGTAFLKEATELLLNLFGISLNEGKRYLAIQVGNEEFAAFLFVFGTRSVTTLVST